MSKVTINNLPSLSIEKGDFVFHGPSKNVAICTGDGIKEECFSGVRINGMSQGRHQNDLLRCNWEHFTGTITVE